MLNVPPQAPEGDVKSGSDKSECAIFKSFLGIFEKGILRATFESFLGILEKGIKETILIYISFRQVGLYIGM